MLRVKKVQYLDGYKLKILFSNGKSKIVDFEDWILEDGVYLKPLKNIQYFKKVRIDDSDYSICWPNGADFCPDTLFQSGREVRASKVNKARHSTRLRRKPRLKRKSTLKV